MPGLYHGNPVCPSVTCVYVLCQTAEHIEILSLCDRPIILVFRHRELADSQNWIYKNGHNFVTGLPIDVMFGSWPRSGSGDRMALFSVRSISNKAG